MFYVELHKKQFNFVPIETTLYTFTLTNCCIVNVPVFWRSLLFYSKKNVVIHKKVIKSKITFSWL